jgi:hypothetical protein
MVHVRGAKRIIHDSIQVASVLSVISRLRPTNCGLMTKLPSGLCTVYCIMVFLGFRGSGTEFSLSIMRLQIDLSVMIGKFEDIVKPLENYRNQKKYLVNGRWCPFSFLFSYL